MNNPQPLTEAEIQSRILHRDAMMLVLDKPAGIAVHVTAHDKVALDASFHHLQFGLPKKPELAHRLDRGTSGCLVLGRHRQALNQLGKLFAEGKIEKTYLAICVGIPAENEGVINRAILKSGQGSKWKLTLDDAGQEAVTEYRVVRTLPPTDALKEPVDSPARGELLGLSVIEFKPKTGRTHQIRLHAAYALGCPIVGDPFYGPAEGAFSAEQQPMMLHAERLVIPLHYKKPPVEVVAPLPPHWLDICQLGN